MAGLLTADTVVMAEHLLQHVAVAHGGADQVDPLVPAELMEAQVAHDGGHDGIADQLTPALQVRAADGHDLVAVDDSAGLVHQEAAVGVAVKGYAHVVSAPDHLLGEVLQMGGTAAVIDVDPIRVPVDEVRMGPETAKELRCRGGGGAIGAVHQDSETGKVALHRGGHKVNIVPL